MTTASSYSSPVTETVTFSKTKPVRVMVVDDHQVVREGLRRMLAMEEGIEVIGEACDGKEAITKAIELSPDVIIMDLKMPGMDGITATHEIKRRLLDVRILILTLYAEDFVKQAIEAGASGYLLKDSDTEQIIDAIHKAREGYYPIAPALTRDIIVEFTRLSRDGRSSILTKRQTEILKSIADGLSSKEIAGILFISTSTVKREIRQILNKLEVSDRAQAVSEAIRRNII